MSSPHPHSAFDTMKPLVDRLLDLFEFDRIINPMGARTYEEALRNGAAVRFKSETHVFLDFWPRTGSWLIGGYLLSAGSIERGNALMDDGETMIESFQEAIDRERGGHLPPLPPIEAYAEDLEREKR